MDSPTLQEHLAREKHLVDKRLSQMLRQEKGIPRHLKGAMRHSLLAGGKRLRPILMLWTFDALAPVSGGALSTRDEVLSTACGLEMLHTYSLIHDDLPAMDDDVLRRGRPTCHVAFDEATAILAGDGLQALAFTVLARHGGPNTARLIQAIGQAVGPAGMVGGQQEDLDAEGSPITPALIRRIHLGKTAALLAAALEGGAIMAGLDGQEQRAIRRAGLNLGLAFQGADDVLDVVASSRELGKSPGKDQAAGKATWVRIEGLAKALARARRDGQRGQKELAGLLPTGIAGDKILALASHFWNRDR